MAGSYPHPQAPVQPYSELEYDIPSTLERGVLVRSQQPSEQQS